MSDAGLLLIQDLAVLLTVAGVVGWFFRRLGLSVVVGYLLAGMLVGPFTPPFSLVSDPERIRALSQLGLVFLMFFVGMRLNLARLRELGWSVILSTVAGAWMVYLGTRVVAAACGWDETAALVLSGMAMVSSSAIIATVFGELGCAREGFARRAMGVTVLEDVVAVVMLTLISSRLQAGAGGELTQVLGMMVVFVTLAVVVAMLVIPRFLRGFVRSSDGDLKVVTVAGLVFCAAWVAAWSGYSVALGAFLLGTVAGGTPFRGRIERALSGTHSLFAAIFFVAIGMLMDPGLFVRYGGQIAGVALALLFIRVSACLLAQMVVGQPMGGALRTALALVPIGEFSYVMAQLGLEAGAVPESFGALAVGTSLLTALAAPWLVRWGAPLALKMESIQPGWWCRLQAAYVEWLHELERIQQRILWWRLTRGRLGQVGLEIVLLSGVLIFSQPLYHVVEHWLGRTGWQIPGWEWGWIGGVGTIALLLTVSIWRNMEAIGMIWAEAVENNAGSARVRLGIPVLAGVQMGTALVLMMIFFLLLPSPGAAVWDELILLGMMALAAWFFSRRLVKWHSQLRLRLAEAVEGHALPTFTGVRRLGESAQAWGVSLMEIEVPEGSLATGKSLRELALRANYGCTVVEIHRHGYVVAAPAPDERVYPGDVLVLAGEEGALGRARAVLGEDGEGRESEQEPVELEELELGSGLRVGATLAELNIQAATGVIILAIRRGEQIIGNPGGSEKLCPGDVLLVLGRAAQVQRLLQRLQRPGEDFRQ